MLRVPKPKGMAIWVVAGFLGMQVAPTWAFSPTGDTGYGTPADTGVPLSTVDGDGDNFSPAQGDCDDNDATAYPGNEEICADRVDNDCNGFYDDGCDGRVQFGTLRGGGGCTGGTGVGNTAFIMLPILPLLLVTRRRT
jgi:hypothetical protein